MNIPILPKRKKKNKKRKKRSAFKFAIQALML